MSNPLAALSGGSSLTVSPTAISRAEGGGLTFGRFEAVGRGRPPYLALAGIASFAAIIIARIIRGG